MPSHHRAGVNRLRWSTLLLVCLLTGCGSHSPAPKIVDTVAVHDAQYQWPVGQPIYYTAAIPGFSSAIRDVRARVVSADGAIKIAGASEVWRLGPGPDGAVHVQAFTPILPINGERLTKSASLGARRDDRQRIFVPVVLTRAGCHEASLDLIFRFSGGTASAHTALELTLSNLPPADTRSATRSSDSLC
jgi:hypothetical protein